jgi:hypothetical protein
VRPRSLVVPVDAGCLLVGCPNRNPGGSGGSGGSSGSSDDDHDAKGTLTLASDGVTRAKLDLDACWSGQMLSFYGVELFHDPDVAKRLRVVVDPVDGPRLVLIGIVADRDRVIVDRSACSKLEVRIEPSDSTINDIRALKGSIAIACTLPEIGTLEVDAKLTACSFDNRVTGM